MIFYISIIRILYISVRIICDVNGLILHISIIRMCYVLVSKRNLNVMISYEHFKLFLVVPLVSNISSIVLMGRTRFGCQTSVTENPND